MNEKQALEVLKTGLDLATAAGVFKNLNDCNAIISAFNVIAQKFAKDEQDHADTNGQ